MSQMSRRKMVVQPEITAIDNQLRDLAKENCNKCHGTGRRGFTDGNPVVCRCTLKNVEPME